MSPVTRPSAPWSLTWNKRTNQDHTLHTHDLQRTVIVSHSDTNNPTWMFFSDLTVPPLWFKNERHEFNKENEITMERRQHYVCLVWTLPCSLLVGSQEDFHILVNVLHSTESSKEILRKWKNTPIDTLADVSEQKTKNHDHAISIWSRQL